MQMLNVSALLTSYETVGDHTEFVAQVSCNGDLWLISRRFSDFDQLHSRLASRFGALLGDARLPEKQWFGRFDPNFLAKRQASLQTYLETLLQVPGILDDRSLQHFLDLEKRVDWNGDLAGGVGSNGRPSGSFPGKSVLLNENDRLNAIVENAGLAFIDISEVPEPLEAEQAVQRKNEIASAAQSLLSEHKIVEHFAATVKVLALPQPPSAARLASEEVVAKLEHAPADGATTYEQDQELLAATLERVEASLRLEIAPPSSDLLVVMELSLTPATGAAAARSSLSGGLEGALLDGDNALSTSFH